MSGMVLTLSGKIFIEVTLHYRKLKYFITRQKTTTKQTHRKSSSGMCVCYLIYKTLWSSFSYECLGNWAKSGVSFSDDLNHPFRGASSTPPTILNLNAPR